LLKAALCFHNSLFLQQHCAEMGDDEVRGMGEAKAAAEAGLKLFAQEEGAALEKDVPGAEAYKKEIDEKIAALEAEAAALTGKDNAKARKDKSKEASNLKTEPKYIDACKVAKGLDPKNGFFVAAPAAAAAKAPAAASAGYSADPAPEADDKKKDDKKPAKKKESAGLSPDEKKELDSLKNDIISRKAALKAEGMSGGQQNKDEEVVRMVNRMNELKEKESPGSTAKPDKKSGGSKKALSSDQEAQKAEIEKEIEEYRVKLKNEFGYSAKDIKNDPDLQEMMKKLDAFK